MQLLTEEEKEEEDDDDDGDDDDRECARIIEVLYYRCTMGFVLFESATLETRNP